MPTFLYASIGALMFAILHGMHFSVSPLPDKTGAYISQRSAVAPAADFAGK